MTSGVADRRPAPPRDTLTSGGFLVDWHFSGKTNKTNKIKTFDLISHRELKLKLIICVIKSKYIMAKYEQLSNPGAGFKRLIYKSSYYNFNLI